MIVLLFAFLTAAGAQEKTCNMGAFVIETDPKGLNVRAEPNASAKILGTIPPMRKEKDGTYQVMPEVSVTGAQNGWFKIKEARDNESLMKELVGTKPRKMFNGEGWVHGSKLTVKSQANRGYEKPDPKSSVIARRDEGSFDGADDFLSFQLKDCQGSWARVQDKRLKSKNQFWLDSICALQETSCN